MLNRDTIQKISKLLQVKEKILVDALTIKKATAGGETVVMNYKMEDVRNKMSGVMRKPVLGVSDQVQHKSGFTAIEDGLTI